MTEFTPDNPGDATEAATTDPKEQIELLSFQVSGQDYAVDIMRVREIRNWSQPTPLPRTPDFVRGVINLRGTVLPILDLSNRLGLEQDDQGDRAVFIVINDGDRLFGVTVDSVSDILTLPLECLQEPPEIAEESGNSCVSHLILEENRMIRVLAAERLAPDERPLDRAAAAG